MSIVVDTSVVVAVLNASDQQHELVRDWILTVDEDLVTTPLAVAEMDRLVGARGGRVAEQALRRDLDVGVYTLRWWADGLRDTLAVADGRPDIGLTDASLVALAARLHTTRIATLDLRHFRSLTTRSGQPFVLLPVDAPTPSLPESEGPSA